MIKTLITDDEKIIREGLAKLLCRDKDVEIVALAEDGELALELARLHRPDLLLVDINMPFMNGLEFISQAKRFLPESLMIVVTGYGEFDYIHTALRESVFDYLLKPVREEALFDCLRRAKLRLAELRKSKDYLAWARSRIRTYYPIMCADFLSHWLDGSFSEEEVTQQTDYLELKIPEPCGLLLASLKVAEQKETPDQAWEEPLLYYAAENIAAELFESYAPLTFHKNAQWNLLMLSACGNADETHPSLRTWTDMGRTLQATLERYLPVNVVYLQKVAAKRAQIPAVYSAAYEQLHQQRRQSKALRQVKQYIEHHYADSGLSLQSAARALGFSSQHISRLFRQEVGDTFVDHLTKIRVRKAISLLTATDRPIYEIAEMLGYTSQQYFSNVFKKMLGVSPLEYRKGEGEKTPE
jgi:two-component system response regulator YesN